MRCFIALRWGLPNLFELSLTSPFKAAWIWTMLPSQDVLLIAKNYPNYLFFQLIPNTLYPEVLGLPQGLWKMSNFWDRKTREFYVSDQHRSDPAVPCDPESSRSEYSGTGSTSGCFRHDLTPRMDGLGSKWVYSVFPGMFSSSNEDLYFPNSETLTAHLGCVPVVKTK